MKNCIGMSTAFCKNTQLTRSVISGFGMCSQRAGAKIGAGPDLYTACKVVNSHPDTACQFAKPLRVCPACHVLNIAKLLQQIARYTTFKVSGLSHVAKCYKEGQLMINKIEITNIATYRSTSIWRIIFVYLN